MKIAIFLPGLLSLAACGASPEPPSVANATAMMADNIEAMAADLENRAQASPQTAEPSLPANAADMQQPAGDGIARGGSPAGTPR